jgi:hypothetical protein
VKEIGTDVTPGRKQAVNLTVLVIAISTDNFHPGGWRRRVCSFQHSSEIILSSIGPMAAEASVKSTCFWDVRYFSIYRGNDAEGGTDIADKIPAGPVKGRL